MLWGVLGEKLPLVSRPYQRNGWVCSFAHKAVDSVYISDDHSVHIIEYILSCKGMF